MHTKRTPLLFDAWERNYLINYYRFLGKMRKNYVVNRYEHTKAVKQLRKSWIELLRNTPFLKWLFFTYFLVILLCLIYSIWKSF